MGHQKHRYYIVWLRDNIAESFFFFIYDDGKSLVHGLDRRAETKARKVFEMFYDKQSEMKLMELYRVADSLEMVIKENGLDRTYEAKMIMVKRFRQKKK